MSLKRHCDGPFCRELAKPGENKLWLRVVPFRTKADSNVSLNTITLPPDDNPEFCSWSCLQSYAYEKDRKGRDATTEGTSEE